MEWRKKLLFVAIVFLSVTFIHSSSFAVPQTINYQGYLTHSNGEPVDQAVNMTFTIYDAATGGNALWSETLSNVLVTEGVFNVILGEETPVQASILSGQLYLGLTVEGDPEMTPRQKLTSVVFAIKADVADTAINLLGSQGQGEGSGLNADLLDGLDGSDFASSIHTHSASDIDGGMLDESLIDPDIARDSEITWSNILGLPAGFADGVDNTGITGEADPTVPSNLKDGVSWGEISGKPSTVNYVYAGSGLSGSATSGEVTLQVSPPLSLTGSSSDAIISSINISNGKGIYGESNSSDGVKGESYGGNGVYGLSTYGTGVRASGSVGVAAYGTNGRGVDAVTYREDSYAVHGKNNVSGHSGLIGGESYGVSGHHNSGTYGILGMHNSGVFGQNGETLHRGSLGNSDSGVFGFHNGTGNQAHLGHSNAAVYAFAFSGNKAGYFNNDVYIGGELSKSGGVFKIDHPLDPENKYLHHSFVESPDSMNIYDGRVGLDNNGEAWVELPDWFQALNKDFCYQLTCIGNYAPVYIAEEISDNRFKIAGGKLGMKVSWQVTGVRRDPYALAHPINVEEEKPPEERGYYLHPEVYGQPEEKGIEWARNPEPMQKINEEHENLSQAEN